MTRSVLRSQRSKVLVLNIRSTSPESLQTIFLGGDCLLHACDDALPQRQIGIEFGAQFCNAQVGGAEQIPSKQQLEKWFHH